jgi:hypothetical protein
MKARVTQMSGLPHRCSANRPRAVLLAMLLGPGACVDRETGDDGIAADPVEHPPELLERHEQACEDWCALLDACDREDKPCDCADHDFSEEHVLCVEKATFALECEAALTCEEIDLRFSGPVQDWRCIGENLAETVACDHH